MTVLLLFGLPSGQIAGWLAMFTFNSMIGQYGNALSLMIDEGNNRYFTCPFNFYTRGKTGCS
jgi:hypothetical protein